MTKLRENSLALKSGDLLPFDKRKSAGRTFYQVDEYKAFGKSEAELQEACEDYLKEMKAPYIHIPAHAYKTQKVKAGIPDLIISIPKTLAKIYREDFREAGMIDNLNINLTLFVELKKRGGKARQGQKNFARHANVYLVDNLPDFKTLVDKFVRL